jgi:sodium/proline symporter
MAIEKPEEIPQARKFAMVWVIISLCAAIFIGLLGQIFFSTPLASPETVFIEMSKATLVSFLAGIVYCGILGAIMSTASSQMLVAASAISQDLYKTFFNKKASQKSLIWISRITVLIVALFAISLSLDMTSSVFGIVSFAWAGFGATFGSVILVGLFWKRMNWQGALAGILAGGITAFLWYIFLAASTQIYEMIPGVLVSLLAIYVVTKITTPPTKEVADAFDAYVEEIGDVKT